MIKILRILSIIVFTFFSCGCVGLIDHPQDIGENFFYLNHMVYYSNDGREQNIDSIFVDNVFDYTFDNKYIIIKCINDSVISTGYNETEENAFVQTIIPDTIFWIIDKKSISKYGAFHNTDFNQACSKLTISLSFD